MSKTVGPIFIAEDAKSNMSAQGQFIVEQEIKALLEKAQQTAQKVLREHADELERLALALLEHETLTREQVQMVLKGKALPRPIAK